MLAGTVLSVAPIGCTTSSNPPEVREREAALIPPDLYQIAPHVALALSPLNSSFVGDHFEHSAESGATGTLLPNDDVLTVAHAFKEGADLAKKASSDSSPFIWTDPRTNQAFEATPTGIVYLFMVNQREQLASVIAFAPADRSNGDWALLSFHPSKFPIRESKLDTSSLSIRFDGSLPIRRGTPLYCLGFPRTPGETTGILGFARSLTIVQGRATRDFDASEEFNAVSESELDMRGMSGGPVGTYDFFKREFTVVGIVTRGTLGYRFLGQRVGRARFLASRIPPVAR